MNKPARVTQAELARAIRAAKKVGARVQVRNGVIEIDCNPISESQEAASLPAPEIAPTRGFRL